MRWFERWLNAGEVRPVRDALIIVGVAGGVACVILAPVAMVVTR